MLGTFEVTGLGPAPSRPLDAYVLSTFTQNTEKQLKEKQRAKEGQGEVPRLKKSFLYPWKY